MLFGIIIFALVSLFSLLSLFPALLKFLFEFLCIFITEEPDGQQLRFGALIGKVSMSISDPGLLTIHVWLQRCDVVVGADLQHLVSVHEKVDGPLLVLQELDITMSCSFHLGRSLSEANQKNFAHILKSSSSSSSSALISCSGR